MATSVLKAASNTKYFFIIVSVFCFSCKKFVEVNTPVTNINSANVYSTDATATSVITGIYASLASTSNPSNGGLATISVFSALSADELTLISGTTGKTAAYYKNQLSTSTAGFEYWQRVYPLIFICNDAISGLENSNTLTPSVKQQLLGEAKFLRAFFYFYLVNLYGDIPLALTTDYVNNSVLARSTVSQIYQQIIADLKDAETLISDSYLNGNLFTYSGIAERVRPTKAAVRTLLARSYLYTKDWTDAESQASSVINNIAMYDTVSLNNVFLKNSKEAIWQLQPTITGHNTEDAFFFNLLSAPAGISNSKPSYLSNFLLNTFEPGDKRKQNWVSSYTDVTGTYFYVNKYKVAIQGAPVSEYITVLRLAELYLIRAEARAQQNKISEAQSDLNIIRRRAGLPNTTAADLATLLNAILHERQVELFTEWGHRWLDLKRSGNINAVMSTVTSIKANGIIWSSTQALYPIPQSDIDKNPNLTQNPGY